MLQITPQMRILAAIEPVDFRKGIDALAQLCKQKLETDPFSGCLFLFRSRSATAIKIWVYDSQGFWIAQKRLSKGRFKFCRGLLLMLERAGEIELPPVRRRPHGRLAKPKPVVADDRPVCGPLSELGPLTIEQVRRTPQEALFNGLVEQYHYLGYEQPVGEHLKYLVSAKGQVIACLAWSSSPRHLGCRDRFIGWGMEARRRNIHLLAYNTRFLILPWVTVPHLASHILGRMAKQVPGDWQRLYAHPVYLLETFVDPERFRGTCYRAANWVVVGRTTGRGKNDLTHKPNRSIKEA